MNYLQWLFVKLNFLKNILLATNLCDRQMIPIGELSTNDKAVIPMIVNFLKKKLLEGRVYKLEHIMTVIHLKWRCIWFPPPPFLYKPLFREYHQNNKVCLDTEFSRPIQNLWKKHNKTKNKIYGRGCKLVALKWIWLSTLVTATTGWNWVGSAPYWQGMASPVCHSSYCYCLPNIKAWCWCPVIVLVLTPGSLIHLWCFSGFSISGWQTKFKRYKNV